MAVDFHSHNVESVEVINSENNANLATTVWAYDKHSDLRCGQLLTTHHSSQAGDHLVTNPAAQGDHVGFVCRYLMDVSDVDLSEQPAETYKILRGVEYLLPESNIAHGVTLPVGHYVCSDANGYYVERAAATDFCAFQVLSTPTGDGTFRAIGVCGQVP